MKRKHMFINVQSIQNAYVGRLAREQFIPLAIVIIVVQMLATYSIINPIAILFGPFGLLASTALVLAYSFATFHVFVRRLHDIGQSGWWVMLMFIPQAGQLLGLILLIYLAIQQGSAHANQYGGVSTRKGLVGAFFAK